VSAAADRAPAGACENAAIAAVAASSLLPFVIFHGMFSRLFWFGDELDLIDQLDRLGWWKWVWLVFAENFVPFFKVLWGGAVYAGGGSYGFMLLLLWLAHGVTVACFGRLLRGVGLGWTAVIAGMLLFGLAPSNYETLTWSVQGSAVLALTFQLLALDACFRGARVGWPLAGVLSSALSFSRGVLAGPLSALATWCSGRRAGRWGRAALLLAPAVLVGLLISVLAEGNHQHMRGHWGQAGIYALWYFCLNPAYALFDVASSGWRTTLILGALKLGLVGWGLRRSGGRLRVLLVVMLAFDLGNAVLLGVGRYHTGIGTVTSSRYQYSSLVAVLPAAGFALERLVTRRQLPVALLRALLGAAGAALAVGLILLWPRELDHFTRWRGTDSRRILFEDPHPDPYGVPGIPFMPMDRAKALIAKYHLH